MIILEGGAARANTQLNALRAMLRAIGIARGQSLGNPPSAISAEADSLSITQQEGRHVLSIDIDRASSGPGGSVSWVLRRLHQLVRADHVEVSATVPSAVGSLFRAFGATLPQTHVVNVTGRQRTVLPGPHDHIAVSAATLHPLTGVHRTDLDIGRTLVHELVIHAWREAFFYQATDLSHPLPSRRIEVGTASTHRGLPHAAARQGAGHNLADAEADLIDYYYDLAMGNDISYGSASHVEFGSLVRRLGVMGEPITRWEQSGEVQRARRAAAEMAAERRRFVAAAGQFQRQVIRMRELEARTEAATLPAESRITDHRPGQELMQERQELATTGPQTRVHLVVRGDNLSAIARSYYGDPSQWRRIYNHPENKRRIGGNPNVIRPGLQLVIP